MPLFIKVVVVRSTTLLKIDSNTDVFQWLLQNFEEQVFYRTFPMVVSKTNKKPTDDNKLVTNYNLRYEQQQRTATICRYKKIRQQKKRES